MDRGWNRGFSGNKQHNAPPARAVCLANYSPVPQTIACFIESSGLSQVSEQNSCRREAATRGVENSIRIAVQKLGGVRAFQKLT